MDVMMRVCDSFIYVLYRFFHAVLMNTESWNKDPFPPKPSNTKGNQTHNRKQEIFAAFE
jgi:hypothetical protein